MLLLKARAYIDYITQLHKRLLIIIQQLVTQFRETLPWCEISRTETDWVVLVGVAILSIFINIGKFVVEPARQSASV